MKWWKDAWRRTEKDGGGIRSIIRRSWLCRRSGNQAGNAYGQCLVVPEFGAYVSAAGVLGTVKCLADFMQRCSWKRPLAWKQWWSSSD